MVLVIYFGVGDFCFFYIYNIFYLKNIKKKYFNNFDVLKSNMKYKIIIFIYFQEKKLVTWTVYIQDFVQFYSFMEFRNKHECMWKF